MLSFHSQWIQGKDHQATSHKEAATAHAENNILKLNRQLRHCISMFTNQYSCLGHESCSQNIKAKAEPLRPGTSPEAIFRSSNSGRIHSTKQAPVNGKCSVDSKQHETWAARSGDLTIAQWRGRGPRGRRGSAPGPDMICHD